MRIICTGGSGFIGTNLITDLISFHHTVLNLDIQPPRNTEHYKLWKQVDIRNSASLKNAVIQFQPEVIVHLAARTDLHGKTLADYSANTDGVINLIDALKLVPTVKKVIFTSSRLVCRIGYEPKSEEDTCPSTLYGVSKVIGEKVTRNEMSESGVDWIILRPTSIWGPWFGTPYKEFFESILNSHYLHPTNTTIYKSFGYVGNSVYLLNKLIMEIPVELKKKTVYLCDFEPIDVLSWAREISTLARVKPPFEVPKLVLQILAKAGDLLALIGMRDPPLTTFRLNNILTNMVYNTTDLQAHFPDLPFIQKDGIINTLIWMKTKGLVNE